MTTNTIIHGSVLDVLPTLPDESVQCCITSPPYWGLRDYGVDGQIGLEKSPEEYTVKMVEVFRQVCRVLKEDGVLWLNLGDSYASDMKGSGGPSEKQLSNAGSFYNGSQRLDHGLKPKDLCGIPWRVAFALRSDGWYLRSDIIWHKPNPMPESVTDRPTKAHEYVFLMSKSERYYYDADAIRLPLSASSVQRLSQDVASQRGSDRVPGKTNGTMKAVGGMRRSDLQGFGLTRGTNNPSCVNENGANRRSVWTVNTEPFPEAHFATFPPDLIKPMVLAGSRPGDIVLDPFMGAGTTALVAKELNRRYLGIELNAEYIAMAERRLHQEVLELERIPNDAS